MQVNGTTLNALRVVLFVVFHLFLVLIAAWDLYWGMRVGKAATVSALVQDAASQYPILAVFAGIVCGHLFWPLSK